MKTEETFIKYEFHRYNITIYESINTPKIQVLNVLERYKQLSKRLQICNNFVISCQEPYKINNTGKKESIGGNVIENNTDIIYTFGNNAEDSVTHELAHFLDKDFKISNSKDYQLAYFNDKNFLDQFEYLSEKNKYVSEYSYNFMLKARDPKSKLHYRLFSEDFAECVKLYYSNKKLLSEKFKKKTQFIENLLDN